MTAIPCRSLPDPCLSFTKCSFVQASPEPVLEPSLASASDDNIAASDSEENELVIDQPMDFSNTASTPLQKVQTHLILANIFPSSVK